MDAFKANAAALKKAAAELAGKLKKGAECRRHQDRQAMSPGLGCSMRGCARHAYTKGLWIPWSRLYNYMNLMEMVGPPGLEPGTKGFSSNHGVCQ